MKADRLQLQRFELKYVVSESLACAARDFVRSYLQLDENGAGKPNLSYPVHSIYLDSPDLALYRQTENGDKNRYKLRIRFYNDLPVTPVFFEIKRRTNEAISKQRCATQRSAVAAVLEGRMPSFSQIFSRDPKHLCALERFIQHVAEIRAAPKAHVAYQREAWISPQDNSARVTMDRDVQFDAEPTAQLSTKMNRPISVFGNSVVLEIKYTGQFPVWFNEFACAFGLTCRSAAKYADGVNLFGDYRLQRAAHLSLAPLKEVA